MSLKGIAKSTIKITDTGGYTAPSGRAVSIRAAVSAAVSGTTTATPSQVAALLARTGSPPTPTTITATDERRRRGDWSARRASRIWCC